MRALPLAALALLAASAAHAEGPPAGPRPATITLQAAGEVRMAPDVATIQLGVTATAPTAGAAAAEEARRMTQVLAALNARGLSGRDVQTAQLSLQPQYAYAQNEAPRLTGYQATNSVVVRVRDLKRLGAAVDAATGAGADTVGGIAFGLDDPSKAEDEARVKAVTALEARAGLYARAAHLKITRLASLSESGGYAPPEPRPMMRMAMAAKSDSTPVEAGEVAVRVEVSAVYEAAPG